MSEQSHRSTLYREPAFPWRSTSPRTGKRRRGLNRPWKGLHIPPMIWAAEVEFDPGTVCVVLASSSYDESDYYRDYQEFLGALRNGKK